MENLTLNQLKTWKWLYIIVFGLIAMLLVSPIAFPMKVNRWTQAYYNFVQNLPEGSLVMHCPDYPAAQEVELGYGYQGMLKQFWLNGLNVILVGINPDAPVMIDHALSSLQGFIKEHNIVYGVDYVALPMITGGDAGQAALAENGKNMLTTDVYGTPVSQIPILQGFNKASDIKLVTGSYSWQAQWYIPYHVPVANLIASTEMHKVVSDFDAGLTVGSIVGVAGTAEFESLLGIYTRATATTSVTNVTMLTLVATTIIVNVAYFAKKMGGK